LTTPHAELTELAENLHVIQHIPQRYFSALCTSSVFFLYELDKFDEFFVAYGERQPTATQSVAERKTNKIITLRKLTQVAFGFSSASFDDFVWWFEKKYTIFVAINNL